MSDRRPEKLYKLTLDGEGGGDVATIDDVLAYVRRGVESGTIKGDLYDTSTTQGWEGIGKYRMSEHQGLVLVIPVSDGGEDRP